VYKKPCAGAGLHQGKTCLQHGMCGQEGVCSGGERFEKFRNIRYVTTSKTISVYRLS